MGVVRCEVAVLGGGPSGCATAIALARAGMQRVVVVEPRTHRGPRVGESIPPDTRLALESLGAWEGFLADEHEPCLGSCSVWGERTPGYNDFLFNPHGHGWHLDRERFDARLAEEAAKLGVERITGCALQGAGHARDGRLELRLRHGSGARTLSARFAVDATGRHARLARALGARRVRHDRITCVTAFTRAPPCVGRLTMLEAVEHGWWYAARLPRERLAVAVASDADFVTRAALHTPAGWRAALHQTEHFARELAGCELGEQLIACSAPSFALDRAAGEDWLAVGDAAAACDPICAQGIHNALHDAITAGGAITASLGGDASALAGYRNSVAARFAAYASQRDHLYGLVRRWATSPFWRRRHASLAGV